MMNQCNQSGVRHVFKENFTGRSKKPNEDRWTLNKRDKHTELEFTVSGTKTTSHTSKSNQKGGD